MSKKGIKISPHRGRTKVGKKPITIFLTEREYDALAMMAEETCRTRTNYATWIVLQGIRKRVKEDEACVRPLSGGE
jgi:hypothetical protein